MSTNANNSSTKTMPGTKNKVSIKDKLPSYYVGIGASAGGLEALQDFFQLMPADSGAAFIVVQHLSPDFKSVVEELLGRGTEMDVFNATDGVLVKANTIYVIPPRKNMMMAEGKLLLVDQMPNRGINFPIDIFFRALAEDQQHRAIGLVLSGTGSDGSRGIRAIKEVGGLVLVQDPETAKFDGMPYNAVKTGIVDVVLPVSEIPEKLMSCISHPLLAGSGETLVKYVETNDAVLAEIYALLKEHHEIDFSVYKVNTVARRIERRIGINQLSNLKDYYSLLIRNPQEIAILAKDMLIGVTRFFRDPEAFSLLETTIIPDILDSTPMDEPIRIWVAGCATGEEAYSVAIIFDELLHKRKEKRTVKIFATDVDPDSISDASLGKYPASSVADINEERLKTYFKIDKEEHFNILPAIRQMVIFAVHNLMKDPPFSNTRLAICRNVLIYFQSEAQQRVLSMLHFSLQKDGYLFLGSSESLGNLQSHFEVINDRCRLYKKTLDTRIPTNTPIPMRQDYAQDALPSMANLLRNYKPAVDRTICPAAVTDALINQYAPPCIVLDERLEIIHVFGDVSAYTRKIKSGKFSSNVKDIIQEELSIALSTAIHRSQKNEENVVYDEVQVTQADGSAISISLRVRHIADPRINGNHFLVSFENSLNIDKKEAATIISYDADDQRRQRIQDLETELQKNEEHLQVTVEELGTTNEELQSSNEELLAANEELQSTNEELQSVNEELYTVNSEYQEKIDELTQVNTDLDNIIKSTTIGIIFLDETMLIRNYTPACTSHVNLLPSDLGRPFHHISHTLIYDTLLNDIANVIEKNTVIEKEAATSNGGVVIVKIAPYYTAQNQANGCVIVMTDITDLYTLQGALNESYQQLRSTISHAFINNPEPIRVLVIDDDKRDREIIKRYLEQASTEYEIIEADSELSAKTQLMESKCDICLIDHYLESTTALALISALPTESRNTAFILLSAHVDQEIKDTALELGIYDAIDKSDLNSTSLERCIRYTLVHKRTEMYLVSRKSDHYRTLSKSNRLNPVAVDLED